MSDPLLASVSLVEARLATVSDSLSAALAALQGQAVLFALNRTVMVNGGPSLYITAMVPNLTTDPPSLELWNWSATSTATADGITVLAATGHSGAGRYLRLL